MNDKKALETLGYWWDADADEIASALTGWVTNQENINAGMRFQNLIYARMASGRNLPMMFGLFMSRRAGPVTANFNMQWNAYQEPQDNVVATVVETLENRIGVNEPWIDVLPNDGDYSVSNRCQLLNRWFAGFFQSVDLYNKVTAPCFKDNLTWGTALCKVAPSWDKKKIEVSRVLCDEILINDAEVATGGDPKSLVQRIYTSRDELLAMVGDDEEAIDAILNAPAAYPAFSYTQDYQDQIPLLEAWKLPRPNGEPGRHVLCLPNFVFIDEPYKKKFLPFAIMRCTRESLGFWGAGVPEALAPYQQEVNRLCSVIHEAQIRQAVGTVLVRNDANVQTNQLANKQARVVRYDNVKPEFVAPPAASPELYRDRDWWKAAAFQRWGLNPQDAAMAPPPGETSGVALRTREQIKDARHISLAKQLEHFVTQIAYLAVDAAQIVKPEVITTGRHAQTIDWDDIDLKPGDVSMQAFPISSLPGEPAGRQDTIADWYANGLITKEQKFKLEGCPDVAGFYSMETAQEDEINQTLDKIAETGEYIPPDVYVDLNLALKTAQKKRAREKTRGAPDQIIKQLTKFIGAIGDLQKNPSGLPQLPSPPAQTPMPQDKGQAPAPPPLATSPASAPPPSIAQGLAS